MRTREIKPGFFKNEDLGALPPLARILFAGLWGLADREGRLEDRPAKIRAEVLPYDAVDGEELVSGLASKGLILRYEAGGYRYIQIVNFLKHQGPHKHEIPSVIPAPGASVDPPAEPGKVPDLPGHVPATPVQRRDQYPTFPPALSALSALSAQELKHGAEPPPSAAPPAVAVSDPGSWKARSPDQTKRLDAVWKRVERKYPRGFDQARRVFYSHMAKENPFFDVAINALISLADHQADDPSGYLKHILKVEEPNACEQRAIHEHNQRKKERPMSLGEIMGRNA